ncbi:MAG: hypothetical protein V4564_11080 [Pseudomonadota bacterium]|uniref:hypothetical protein n=1 Tax=Sphingomonas sp. ERG5 TaxID=1381597 RepID=UPI00054BF66E|nr:hypothetical protein [Sphingomonas sp. ERG5]
MNDEPTQLVIFLFPVLFIGMWLMITTMLGAIAGWFTLQQHYPASDQPILLKLRARSGSMGPGVALSGILTLSAGPSGLRVGISRLFGPFQKPFLVPWREIRAEAKTFFFVPMVKLSFGNPTNGTLKIDARTWQRLAAHSPSISRANASHVSLGQNARGLLLQWACITLIIGSFFYVTSRVGPQSERIPLLACFGFPGILYGFGQLIRFLRQ